MNKSVMYLSLILSLSACGPSKDSGDSHPADYCASKGFYGTVQSCVSGSTKELAIGTPCSIEKSGVSINVNCPKTGMRVSGSVKYGSNTEILDACKNGILVLTMSQKAYTFVSIDSTNYMIELPNGQSFSSNYGNGCQFSIKMDGSTN